MNEEVDQFVRDIEKLTRDFEEQPDEKTASLLEKKLTVMKLLVGIDNFLSLNAYSRLERKVSSYLDSLETPEEEPEETGGVKFSVDRIGEALGISAAWDMPEANA